MRSGKSSTALKTWWEATVIQFGAIGATYSMGVALFLLARLVIGEKWEFIGLLNHVIPWLLLGTVCAAVVTSVTSYRRIWLLYTLPGVLAFLIFYAPLFLPSPPSAAAQAGDTLTVATYNLKLLTRQRTADNIAKRWQVIEALNADIVAFQEIEGNPFRKVANPYPYNYYEGTIGVISRYPLHPETAEGIGVRFTPRQPSFLRIEATVNEQRIAIYAGHLVRPDINIRPLGVSSEQRADAVGLLVERLAQETLPTVMLCDCNMTAATDDYHKIAAYLHDGWWDKGFGFGFTAPADPTDIPFPVIRSDYMWYSSLQLQEIVIWPDAGSSDHFPLIATINLP